MRLSQADGMLVKSPEYRFSHVGNVNIYGVEDQSCVFRLPRIEVSFVVIRCDFKYRLES